MCCRKCCGCHNNCGCGNGCGNNCGGSAPVRRGCTCLANDLQSRIDDLVDDIEDLQEAFDRLEDEDCIRKNAGCGNNCGCHGCGCHGCGGCCR